jgi:hypothetical protein
MVCCLYCAFCCSLSARSEFLASAGCFVFYFTSASSVLSPFGSRVTTDRGLGHRGKSDFYSVVRQFEGWSKPVALSPLEFSHVDCSIWSPSPLNLGWSSATGRSLLFLASVLLERGVRPVHDRLGDSRGVFSAAFARACRSCFVVCSSCCSRSVARQSSSSTAVFLVPAPISLPRI